MDRWRRLAILAVLTLSGLFPLMAAASGDDVDDADHDFISGRPSDPSDAWLVMHGGKIYADWVDTLLRDAPEETKGCTDCHGWNYKGLTAPAKPRAEADVAATLKDNAHGFANDDIPAEEIASITAFLNHGVLDASAFVDPATGKSKGAADRGKPYFQTICAACHGYDGRTLGFWDGKTLSYVGTEANTHPLKVFHYIRFGHPAEPMVSLYLLGPDKAADILAYVQTLPQGDD